MTQFISVFNRGALEMGLNHLASLKKCGIDNYCAYVPDLETRDTLRAKGYHAELADVPDHGEEAVDFGGETFNNMSYMRYQVIERLLRQGKRVWYLDVDTVALYNLNKCEELTQNYDIIFQNDLNMVCTGCMCFSPNEVTIRLAQIMYRQRNKEHNDQVIMASILRDLTKVGIIRIKLLDSLRFPNGLLYFPDYAASQDHKQLQEQYRQRAVAPYFVHANWMIGNETKRRALQSKGLWYNDYVDVIVI